MCERDIKNCFYCSFNSIQNECRMSGLILANDCMCIFYQVFLQYCITDALTVFCKIRVILISPLF